MRWLTYASVFLAAGAFIFALFVHDGREDERPAIAKFIGIAAVSGAAATILEFVFHYRELTALGSPEGPSNFSMSAYGTSVLVRFVGLGLMAYSARSLTRESIDVAGLTGAALALGSFALLGHTAVTTPRTLVVAANLVHTTAASIWFGSLGVLFVVLRHRRRTHEEAARSARMLNRFGIAAGLSVAAAALAGTLLAWAELRSPGSLFNSAYGWTLMGKLVLVGLVMAMGAYNHRVLVPAVVSGHKRGAWTRLRRTVRTEIAGLVMVLAVTAAFVNIGAPA
jgi:copper transport protein